MDHPFSFRIPWIRILNRWVVVVYISFIHPFLLFRRYYHREMMLSTYFWIFMAVVVLALYLPQVIRDMKQAVKIEFDGLVLTFGFLFKANMILPISSITQLIHNKNDVTLITDDGKIELTKQLPKASYQLLTQLHHKFGKN